ncbi:hypothetical protein FRC0418_02251 [Corynebacterium diphtheriae]|nr:hypothetical protein FRC0418_02251 [Corynebacterium diphtheriae]CAB0974342.1 hypothetical protein FRC0448_02219 [Corynebacterium diphtheriae]
MLLRLALVMKTTYLGESGVDCSSVFVCCPLPRFGWIFQPRVEIESCAANGECLGDIVWSNAAGEKSLALYGFWDACPIEGATRSAVAGVEDESVYLGCECFGDKGAVGMRHGDCTPDFYLVSYLAAHMVNEFFFGGDGALVRTVDLSNGDVATYNFGPSGGAS